MLAQTKEQAAIDALFARYPQPLIDKLADFEDGLIPASAFSTEELKQAISMANEYLQIRYFSDVVNVREALMAELATRPSPRKTLWWILGGVSVAAAVGTGIYLARR
jgi:hypothetical protein